MGKNNCVVQFLELVQGLPCDKHGCKIWPKGISRTGYGVYSIGNFTYSVPRLLYNTLRNGRYRDGLVIRHKCDNRACCNIDHLEIGTQSQNLMDASIRNRLLKGENNNKSRLSNNDVLNIRASYPQKSTVELANEYDTTPFCINCVVSGKTWKHLPGAKKIIKENRAVGEKMGRSKLTRESVLEIREKYPQKTGPELAKEYGVGHAMIYSIIKRKSWGHI